VTTRVLLADDHPLILDALEALLRSDDDMAVVARCQSGTEALAAIRHHRPDVVVLDLQMPVMDGLAVLRAMKEQQLGGRVVLLTAAAEDEELLEALRLGVQGIFLKEMAPRLFLQCIRSVAAGRQWLERHGTARALASLLKRERSVRAAASAGLTQREVEIVHAIAGGLRNKAIADRLRVSEGTIKVHLHNIYRKLGVDGRLGLIVYAKEHGLYT
jgi:DNA-binding NarL/FixJ family response regulator